MPQHPPSMKYFLGHHHSDSHVETVEKLNHNLDILSKAAGNIPVETIPLTTHHAREKKRLAEERGDDEKSNPEAQPRVEPAYQ